MMINDDGGEHRDDDLLISISFKTDQFQSIKIGLKIQRCNFIYLASKFNIKNSKLASKFDIVISEYVESGANWQEPDLLLPKLCSKSVAVGE